MNRGRNLCVNVGLAALVASWSQPCFAQSAAERPATGAAVQDDQAEESEQLSDAQKAEEGADTSAQAQRVLTGRAAPTKKAARARAAGRPEPEGPQVSNQGGRLEGDIVVIGLKENVASARAAKRRADQIVDIVLAQDIGKLPDKNVPEALARVPGVQIDRNRGEGTNVLIRGLGGVMTTINGSPTSSAGDRTTYLNDISSDLVAGLEVFKTRTPDQVEGSQTGVINLTMRRPGDFKEGATYAFSARGDYNDQIKRVNPFFSALVGYNGDTPIGRMGFLVNGTFNRLSYAEPARWNGFPVRPADTRQLIEPSTTPGDIFMPGSVGFSGTDGWSRRSAFRVSADWRPSDELKIIAEGGYSHQNMLWADSLFIMDIVSPRQRLTNIVLNDDNRSVKSVSVDGVAPIGPGRQSWLHETRQYEARLQMDYITERVELIGVVNYVKSNNESDNIFHWIRFNETPSFDVVFNTDNDPRGGPAVTFKGIDLLDRANYRHVDGFDQSRQYTFSRDLETKFDLRLNTFWEPLDYFKIGLRIANRSYDRGFGSRAVGGLRIPIDRLPDYSLIEIGRSYSGQAGVNNANWLIGDTGSIRRSFGAIRGFISGVAPNYLNPFPTYNPNLHFTGSDGSVAAYGMAHYNVKLLFPINGVIGVRAVNSITSLNSTQTVLRRVTTNGITREENVRTAASPRGNYFDLIPSANAIVNFTPKFQLRLAYTSDIGRPSAYDINPVVNFNLLNQLQPTAVGGNADLQAIKSIKYDASLEWYFGKTGLMSVAVWHWNQNGQIARRILPETFPELSSLPLLIDRPVNLGRGQARGVEGQVTTFFSFLPGILRSFGTSVNGTVNVTRVEFPVFNAQGEVERFITSPFINVSKYMFNVVGFFEKDGLNVRLAYNWRSRRQLQIDGNNPFANRYLDPIERLDLSINYDITKNFTVALQADNLTRDGEQVYFGTPLYPQDVRNFARNFTVQLRTRF